MSCKLLIYIDSLCHLCNCNHRLQAVVHKQILTVLTFIYIIIYCLLIHDRNCHWKWFCNCNHRLQTVVHKKILTVLTFIYLIIYCLLIHDRYYHWKWFCNCNHRLQTVGHKKILTVLAFIYIIIYCLLIHDRNYHWKGFFFVKLRFIIIDWISILYGGQVGTKVLQTKGICTGVHDAGSNLCAS
jgi:hypothetical protein